MHIHTESVGQNFGRIGVFRAAGVRIETEVMGYGCETAARQGAYEAAVRAGLIRELGEMSYVTDQVRDAVRAVLLLDRYVVVAGDDVRPDALICGDLERLLQGAG